MPELIFKGKEFVFNHHLTVPYRPLLPDANKSVGEVNLNGNLIIQGDNLHVLKALQPQYAGKIDCIFIDPPYNTGNEAWCYNDNVNSPIMREWLSANPVNKEDMLRHDKWLAMMWPRISLMRELLCNSGTIWITLDDNEFHGAKLLMDEIFAADNFLGSVVWEKGDSPRMDADYFSTRHDYILCYAKDIDNVHFKRINPKDDIPSHYNKKDENGNIYYTKPLRAMGGQGESRESRKNLYYAITAPDGTLVYPKMKDGRDGAWRWSKKKLADEAHRIEWVNGKNGWVPYFRIFADDSNGMPPETIFYNSDVGSSRSAKAEIKAIFYGEKSFDTPKPTSLIKKILEISTTKNSIVLDSFSGSGSTAQAVLELNAADNGNRKFILAECEDYADTLTAERVRRVLNGYPYQGTQKEVLFKEKLTWTRFQRAQETIQKVAGLETLHEGRYDRIKKEIKDGELVVYGEKAIEATMQGLGGSFTYCTLGAPFNMDALLSGENLPDYTALGGWVFHTATGEALPEGQAVPTDFYLGESSAYHVWLIYKPDLEFLKSGDSALTLSRAEKISKSKTDGKKHLVFAPAKFVPNKVLLDKRVEFAQLPYALYRREQA